MVVRQLAEPVGPRLFYTGPGEGATKPVRPESGESLCFDSGYPRRYDARPMSYGWPATIDPIQLAKRGEQLAGPLALRHLPRVATMCVSDEGEFDVVLDFTHSETADLFEMVGHVRGEVSLTCQRCLEPMRLPLDVDFRVTLRRPNEREGALEEPDVLVVDKPMSVAELVEDELLLAMPMIPMHARADCPAGQYVVSDSEQRTRESPFAALAPTKARGRTNKT